MTNLVMNGGLNYDQANEGAQITVSSGGVRSYLADGFTARVISANGGMVKYQRVSDAPPGLKYSLEAKVTTVATSVDNGDMVTFQIPLDETIYRQLAFGDASAKATSKNIWIKPSINMTAAIGFVNLANTRSLINNVALTANIWNNVTIDNIPGCPDGSWAVTSSSIGYLTITAVAGSTWNIPNPADQSVWQSNTYLTSNTQTNTMLTTANSTFRIAGLNHVIGATNEPYQEDPHEYSRVARFYCKSWETGVAVGTTGLSGTYQWMGCNVTGIGTCVNFPVEMRKVPNNIVLYSTQTGTVNRVYDNGPPGADRTPTIYSVNSKGFLYYVIGLTSGSHDVIGNWIADARLS